MKSKALILTVALALAGVFAYSPLAYAGFPNNPNQALRLAVHLSHRTDYCLTVNAVTTDDTNPDPYLDSISHNIPSTVSPGQRVDATFSYDVSTPGGSPIIYDTVYADWNPDNELAGISYTLSSSSSKTLSFSFNAPGYPGEYRIRWTQVGAYLPIHSFFGGTSGSGQPGYGDYRTSPPGWLEVVIQVVR